MKGGASWGSTKRRWRWLVIGVLGLVLLSMLVPLVFLLGFHSPGYVSEQRNSPSIDFKDIDRFDASSDSRDQSERHQSTHIEDIIKRLAPTVFKNGTQNSAKETNNITIVQSSQQTKGFSTTEDVLKPFPNIKDTTIGDAVTVSQTKSMKIAVVDGEIFCEVKYGSYCIWRQEHREEMQDSMVKKLKDQLFVARAYYPSVAKLPAHDKLSREMKQNIQELERILSESTTDADLPPQMEKSLHKMGRVIAKAKSLISDCNNVDKKLRQLVDLTEDEANFHMKQSAYLHQIAVQTVPKSHHCLSMRLTVEYFTSPSPPDTELLLAAKYMEPAMQHYIILSNNVLASSVVINSTVMHSKDRGNLFFHVVTDGHNYFAMKLWFFKNTYKEAIVEVMNIEDLDLPYHDKAALHLSLSEEFRVSFRTLDSQSATRVKTDYLSVLSHSHFLLPEIFHNLNKIVVLDDDVIVQQDLSALLSLDMEGKVIGAAMYCKVKLGQLKIYFGENRFDDDSCTWMSGLNVINLVQWREQNLTGTYQMLLKEDQSHKDESTGITALRVSLLTLQNKIYPLDDRWILSGLGHDYGLNIKSFKSATVLHYNGKMKPWLDMGIPKYKKYWNFFLNFDNRFLSDCNINP